MKRKIIWNMMGYILVLPILVGCAQYRNTYERPMKLVYTIDKGKEYYDDDKVYKIIYEEEGDNTTPSFFEFAYLSY